jgi:hypothetical protein
MLIPRKEDGKTSRASRGTDIYALGILMWETLTGQYPYGKLSIEQQMKALRDGQRPNLDLLNEYVPREFKKTLKSLIKRCWSTDRKARPSAVECYSIISNVLLRSQDKEYDIFFSHPWMEKDFLDHVFTLLSEMEFRIWYDKNDMGYTIEESMFEGIKKSSLFLCCLSSTYLLRSNCMKELRKAAELNKRIIVLIIESDWEKAYRDKNKSYFAWNSTTTSSAIEALIGEVQTICNFKNHLFIDLTGIKNKFDWHEKESLSELQAVKLWDELKPLFRLIRKAGIYPRSALSKSFSGYEDATVTIRDFLLQRSVVQLSVPEKINLLFKNENTCTDVLEVIRNDVVASTSVSAECIQKALLVVLKIGEIHFNNQSWDIEVLAFELAEALQAKAGSTEKWFDELRNSGNYQAVYLFGRCYQEGKGTEKNLEKALECFICATDGGIEKAKWAQRKLNMPQSNGAIGSDTSNKKLDQHTKIPELPVVHSITKKSTVDGAKEVDCPFRLICHVSVTSFTSSTRKLHVHMLENDVGLQHGWADPCKEFSIPLTYLCPFKRFTINILHNDKILTNLPKSENNNKECTEKTTLAELMALTVHPGGEYKKIIYTDKYISVETEWKIVENKLFSVVQTAPSYISPDSDYRFSNYLKEIYVFISSGFKHDIYQNLSREVKFLLEESHGYLQESDITDVLTDILALSEFHKLPNPVSNQVCYPNSVFAFGTFLEFDIYESRGHLGKPNNTVLENRMDWLYYKRESWFNTQPYCSKILSRYYHNSWLIELKYQQLLFENLVSTAVTAGDDRNSIYSVIPLLKDETIYFELISRNITDYIFLLRIFSIMKYYPTQGKKRWEYSKDILSVNVILKLEGKTFNDGTVSIDLSDGSLKLDTINKIAERESLFPLKLPFELVSFLPSLSVVKHLMFISFLLVCRSNSFSCFPLFLALFS